MSSSNVRTREKLAESESRSVNVPEKPVNSWHVRDRISAGELTLNNR
jgi:hypothetical protein